LTALQQKLLQYRLILASQSPRRQELLRGLDIPFSVAAPYSTNEAIDANIATDDVPIYLAKLKADNYPYPIEIHDIIITADTLVRYGNKFLGKPKDEHNAREMLQTLSGRTHEVITGVCLRTINNHICFSASTLVTFADLKDDEINYYLQKYQPYDKAGAYGIQEWIGYVGIERVEGSYYNVMGLPLHKLYRVLETSFNNV
jgi:septum formation protein